MVTWSETPQSSKHPRAYKSMVWAHAVLAGWQSSSKLLIIDVDEFLVYNPSWSTQEFLNTCVGNASQATVARFDTACKSCTDAESDAAAFGWMSKSMPKDSYTCSSLQLRQYGSITGNYPEGSGKSIVSSHNTHGFAIHGGHTVQGPQIYIHQNCAKIVHLVNFWKKRSEYTENLPIIYGWLDMLW